MSYIFGKKISPLFNHRTTAIYFLLDFHSFLLWRDRSSRRGLSPAHVPPLPALRLSPQQLRYLTPPRVRLVSPAHSWQASSRLWRHLLGVCEHCPSLRPRATGNLLSAVLIRRAPGAPPRFRAAPIITPNPPGHRPGH